MTCKEPYKWEDPTGAEWEFAPSALAAAAGNGNASAPRFNVVAYDYGIKTNILRRLASFGCDVTVVPADYPAEKVGRERAGVRGVCVGGAMRRSCAA